MTDVLTLSEQDVRASGILAPAVATATMREVLLAKAAGTAVDAPLTTLPVDLVAGHRFVAHPASIAAELDVAGVKWIGANTANPQLFGLPRATATVVVNDRTTAVPCAVVAGTAISATRSAAVCAVAAEVLVPIASPRIAFIGAGVCGREAALHLAAVFPGLTGVSVFDISAEAARDFAAMAELRDLDIRVCVDAEEAVVDADVVVLATSDAVTPYVAPQWLAPNAVVLSISLNDLTTDTVAAAGRVVTTDAGLLDYRFSSTARAVEEGRLRADQVLFLEDLLERVSTPQDRVRGPVLFDLWGLGMFDLALAARAAGLTGAMRPAV